MDAKSECSILDKGFKKNYLFELLNNITTFEYNQSDHYGIAQIAHKLRDIIINKIYDDPNNLLYSLHFNVSETFIIVSTKNISANLRHNDPHIDRVLHQMKTCVFEKETYYPLFYLNKSINVPNNADIQYDDSYIKTYLYDKIDNFENIDFDNKKISVYKNHIGSYMVIFYHSDKWYFLFDNNIYEFKKGNHLILHNHLHKHIDKLDKNLCYHLILVDSRLRQKIAYFRHNSYIVLIKTTEKYTMYEDYAMKYGFFVPNNRICMSCMEELHVYLEELNRRNIRNKKILDRGLVMKINIDDVDNMYLCYDTFIYRKIANLFPKHMNHHIVYLKLYQNNKLNDVLQYIDDSYIDIVKRINMSMSTISREILDIYHMTRNQNNSNLYYLLPHTYRHILYHLHSDYIKQKNTNIKIDTHFEDSMTSVDKMTNPYNLFHDTQLKVSITVDNVYMKLKELDGKFLVQLYKDREILIDNIANYQGTDIIKNPIKTCICASIQSKLLSI